MKIPPPPPYTQWTKKEQQTHRYHRHYANVGRKMAKARRMRESDIRPMTIPEMNALIHLTYPHL